MILDSDRQREILLAAMQAASWPGANLREAAAVLDALERAPVALPPEPDKNLAPPPETA